MTPIRVIFVVLATTAGFVVGFYAGLIMLLSIVGIDDFQGWQFELATVPTGGLCAGLVAAGASPSTQRIWVRVVTATLMAALAATGVLNVIGGDFGIAIGLGGLIVVVAATVTATLASSRMGTE